MKATAKALEQFATGKNDDDEKQLYHDEKADKFEYRKTLTLTKTKKRGSQRS